MRGWTFHPSKTHDNNFNFLRLLFASFVLLAHAPEIVDGDRSRELMSVIFHNSTVTVGTLSVSGFFLISGYLILQSWMRTPRIPIYLSKRFRRIVPGFLVASLISAFIVGPLGSSPSEFFAKFSFGKYVAGTLLLAQPHVPEVFHGRPYTVVNASMWTIQYEFLCYLSVIVLSVVGLVKRPKLYLAFTFLLFIGSLLLEQSSYSTPQLRWLYLFPADIRKVVPLTLFFCVGGCYFLFLEKIAFSGRNAIVALALFIAGLFVPSLTLVFVATGGAYLLFFLAFTKIRGFAWFNSQPDISYGVYLYGWPIQKLLNWYLPEVGPWTLLLLTIPACAVCGWLSYQWVEKPFLAAKRRPVEPSAASSTVPVQA